jgi:ATP-binding cassette subfamily F protein uup
MDNVVTSLLVLSGDGSVEEHAGGFSDWEARGGRLLPLEAGAGAKPVAPAPKTAGAKADPAPLTAPKGKKLSYKEQRELDALPGEIEALESRQGELEQLIADPAFYQGEPGEVQKLLDELAGIGPALEEKLERWTELDERG